MNDSAPDKWVRIALIPGSSNGTTSVQLRADSLTQAGGITTFWLVGQEVARFDSAAVSGIFFDEPAHHDGAGGSEGKGLDVVRRAYPRAYAPWTSEDDAHLLLRHRAGATTKMLVQEFGRQPGGITSRLKKLLEEPPEDGLDPPTSG